MMVFSDEVVEEAWQWAGERCECHHSTHNHPNVRCDEPLVLKNRGREREGAWEAHHKSSTGGDDLSNCEILCWNCHSETL